MKTFINILIRRILYKVPIRILILLIIVLVICGVLFLNSPIENFLLKR